MMMFTIESTARTSDQEDGAGKRLGHLILSRYEIENIETYIRHIIKD